MFKTAKHKLNSQSLFGIIIVFILVLLFVFYKNLKRIKTRNSKIMLYQCYELNW